MLSLNILIDDVLLCSYVIANNKPERFIPNIDTALKEDIVAFQNLAWNKSKDKYRVLSGLLPLYIFKARYGIDYSKVGSEIDIFISELISTNEYKKLKEQTAESKDKVLKEWEENFDTTSAYITNLGIKVEGEYHIYLVHPGLRAGTNTGDRKIIWSCQDHWPNYNTIYLWHEILHSHIEHEIQGEALIELITDEEMRIRLNGGQYPPYAGRKELAEEKDKLLDKWHAYLNSEKKDINLVFSES